MVKVSVLYPYTEGARFDHAYYRDKHVPMLRLLLGEGCRECAIDKGLAGGRPGSKPPFEAACHMVFDSVDAFQASFGPHAKKLSADMPNYTDIVPVMQVSEVVG